MSIFPIPIVGVLVLALGGCHAFDYILELESKEIFLPCDDHPDDVLANWVDLSEVKKDFDANGVLLMSGPVKIVTHFPAERPVQMESKVFKKVRGTWIHTPFGMRRSDFCRALFLPTEMWYQYSKIVPKANRHCPMPYGFTQEFKTTGAIIISIPDKKSEGDYLIQVTMYYGKDRGELVCTKIPIHLTRK